MSIRNLLKSYESALDASDIDKIAARVTPNGIQRAM
jgi:hypothetical protein